MKAKLPRGPKTTECFRPMLGFKEGLTDNGKDSYRWLNPQRIDDASKRQRFVKMLAEADVLIPCGKCIACLTNRAGEWGMRCWHEQQFRQNGVFATFTYDDEHNPITLDSLHWRQLIQNLRNANPDQDVRYFACGEYGEVLSRPHFHALLWNVDAPVRHEDFFSKSKRGNCQYRSRELEKAWQHKGHVTIADKFDAAQAGYIAKYVAKGWTESEGEVVGPNGLRRDQRIDYRTGEVVNLVRPFIRVSTKPAIGFDWYQKFGLSDMETGFLIFNGTSRKIPRTYLRWLERDHPEAFARIKERAQKYIDANGYFEGDSSCVRLEARERVVHSMKKGAWVRE